MALTKRRQLFVTEYLANPKQPASWAAVRAGFSRKRARETASELLKDPEIKAAIEHQLQKRLEKLEITEQTVLRDILGTRERCIEAGAGAWQTTGRLKCDELLGKYLKMWVDKVEVDLADALIERLTAGRKRAGAASCDATQMTPEIANPEFQLADDIAGFYSDPLGFVMYAYPWGQPGRLEQYDGPDQWQRDALLRLGEEIKLRKFDGVNPVEPIRIVIVSGHGVGKGVLCAFVTHFVMSTRPRARGTVTATTFSQLSTKTWAAIRDWGKLLINRHWFEITSDSMYFKGQKESWAVSAQSCKEENSEAFAGQHAADSTSFYILDEASGVPEKIWEVAEGGRLCGCNWQGDGGKRWRIAKGARKKARAPSSYGGNQKAGARVDA